MKSVFFTSDLHFGHERIAMYTGRPWKSIEEHDQALAERWNAVVKAGDTTYILGDFAMPRKTEIPSMKVYSRYLNRLHGKKILIKGNHDKMSQDMYKQFTEVWDMREINLDNRRIVMLHYPMRSWNASFHGSWHFFGHVHGRLPDMVNSMSTDVGVDTKDANYTPYPWEFLKNKMDNKYELWKDYWAKENKNWKV